MSLRAFWLRLFWLRLVYGKNPCQSMKGDSLPTMIRKVRQAKLDGQPDQVPTSRYPLPDDARLRAKECVTRLKLVHRKRA